MTTYDNLNPISSKDVKKLTQQEAADLIAPKRTYTDAEHVEAWYKFVLDSLREDILYSLFYEIEAGKMIFDREKKEYLKNENGDLLKVPMTPEMIRNDLEKIIFPDGEDADDKGRPWYERSINYYWRDNFRTIAESGQHCGDCTAVPASCGRCIVDEFYGVDTKAWNSKFVGSELMEKATPQKKVDK